MSDVRLTTPRLTVYPPEGEPYTVQVINQDMVAYETTAYRHKWPPMEKAPISWLSFLAWHAARRTGRIDGAKGYDTFRDEVLSVAAEDDEGDADDVDPTEPGPG